MRLSKSLNIWYTKSKINDTCVIKEVKEVPKIVDYEAKKRMIMEKAVESFLQKGFHNTHLVDITSACGIGRTTIYQYFRNKDEILQYTIVHLFESLRDDFRGILADEADGPLQTIRKLIPAILEQYNSNRKLVVLVDLWLIMIREEHPSIELVNEHMAQIRHTFQELLEQGIKNGEIRDMPTPSMAFTLYVLVESFLIHLALHQGEDVHKHIGSVQLLLDSLQAN